MFKQPKAKLILWAAGILIIVLLILAALPAKKKDTFPTTINIPAFNQELNPPATFTPAQDLPPEQKVVNVYQLTGVGQQSIQNFFQPVANDLNLLSAPELIDINKVPHLFWEKPPNFLTVNLVTGDFSVDLHEPPVLSTSKISEADALLFVKNWLSRYHLFNDQWQHQTQYFANTEIEEFSPVADASQAEVYIFSFSPTIDTLPVFNTTSTAKEPPVVVTIDALGNILNIYYRLPSLFFAGKLEIVSAKRSVLTTKQVGQKIAEQKPVITAVNFTEDRFVPSTEPLSNLVYNQVTLGYSNDVSGGYLLPVFQLTGTAQLNDGQTVKVTAYLPALAE